MKHTYSSGKYSCSKLAATLYGRGILFTEKNPRKPNTHDYIVIEKRKKLILTHIRFEYILEAS